MEILDLCAARLNTLLKDVDAVAHLLPILPGGDDLCKKVRDGLLLCAYLSKIPGQEHLIDISKLHHPEKNEGKTTELPRTKAVQNQEILWKAAASVGIHTADIGSFDMMRINRTQLLPFVRELLIFDMMTRLNAVNTQTDNFLSASLSSVSACCLTRLSMRLRN